MFLNISKASTCFSLMRKMRKPFSKLYLKIWWSWATRRDINPTKISAKKWGIFPINAQIIGWGWPIPCGMPCTKLRMRINKKIKRDYQQKILRRGFIIRGSPKARRKLSILWGSWTGEHQISCRKSWISTIQGINSSLKSAKKYNLISQITLSPKDWPNLLT